MGPYIETNISNKHNMVEKRKSKFTIFCLFMKQLQVGILLLPLDGTLVNCRLSVSIFDRLSQQFAVPYLSTWLERRTVNKVSC